LATATEQCNTKLGLINHKLKAYGVSPASDGATGKAMIAQLRKRRDRLDEDERKLAELRKEIRGFVRDADELEASAAAHDCERAGAEGKHVECARELDDALAVFGEAEIGTAEDADRQIACLGDRLNRHRATGEAVRNAQRRMESLNNAIGEDRKRLTPLLTRLGLELPSDEEDAETMDRNKERLRTLDREYPRYCDVRKAADDAEAIAKDRESSLRRRADYAENLLELSDTDLNDQLGRARQSAERVDEFDGRIKEVEADVRHLRQGHELEEAITRREKAHAALARRRDETFAANVGHLLVEFLRRRNQAGASAVLKRARELFSRITSGSYAIEVSGADESCFVARDTATGEIRTPEQLSSGTRVQLLIAVRMAFIEVKEGDGPRLPLVLDEALGNSDDRRAPELIDAVLSIAREGRQVFYFTARWDEVHKWRQSIEADNARQPETTRVPFAELQLPTNAPAEHRRAPEPVVPPPPVPEPEGRDHEQYGGVLGVPRIDQWSPVSAVHLWYVVDDPRALHQCLARGIESWGHLASVLGDAGEEAPARLGITDDPRFAPSARAAASLFERFFELWRIGRGRPVGRDTLAASESPFANSTHLESLVALADECGGDGEALMERAPGIHRFGQKGQDKLREYLEGTGHLDPRPRLPDSDLRVELATRLAESSADVPIHLLTPQRVNELLLRAAGSRSG